MQTDGIEVASVGNTIILHDSCLVEAFNLKAAIQYNLKNSKFRFEQIRAKELDFKFNNRFFIDYGAKEALTDMPPRSESEIDPITLHNLALMNIEEEPSAGFDKLQFLIQQNTFPEETFANLCFLYVKYSYYSLVADVLAENSHLTYKYLTPVSSYSPF
jgi:tetratricopeptide repeat protein 30